MGAKNSIEIATNPKYIKEVSDVKYGLNINNIISSKSKHKSQTEMISDYRALDRI